MARHESGKHKGGDGKTGKSPSARKRSDDTAPITKPLPTSDKSKEEPRKDAITRDIMQRGD